MRALGLLLAIACVACPGAPYTVEACKACQSVCAFGVAECAGQRGCVCAIARPPAAGLTFIAPADIDYECSGLTVNGGGTLTLPAWPGRTMALECAPRAP